MKFLFNLLLVFATLFTVGISFGSDTSKSQDLKDGIYVVAKHCYNADLVCIDHDMLYGDSIIKLDNYIIINHTAKKEKEYSKKLVFYHRKKWVRCNKSAFSLNNKQKTLYLSHC